MPSCSLQALKIGVSSGGTLNFNCTTSTIIPIDADLTVAKDLTLTNTGAGKLTISGANQYQIFHINAGIKLSLNNLTLDGGHASPGGAIYNGGTLTITNSTFSNNSAPNSDGGAIYNGGTLTITNSTFSNNSAPVTAGGAIENSVGTVRVINSTFSNNSASSYGGAIENNDTVES